MLLMIEKGMEEEYVTLFIDTQNLITNTWKIMIKKKTPPYLQYWDANKLYGWAISQKFPVNNFEWIEDTSKFNEDFINNYNVESNEGYFLEVDAQCLEKITLTSLIHDIYQKE